MALKKTLHSSFSSRVLPPLLTLQQSLVTSKNKTARYIREGLRFRAESESWDSYRKTQWILDRLRRVLRGAAADTAYYQEIFRNIGFDPQDDFTFADFARLPVLERSTILNRGPELISTAKPKSDLQRDASGGSSGQPAVIWVGPEESGWNLSAHQYFAEKLGLRPGASRAFLWGHHLDPGYKPSLSRKAIFFIRNEKWFDCFRLSDDVLMGYHRAMERFTPEGIIAYAHAIAFFADFLRSKGLNPSYPTKCIVTGAEKLFDDQRQRVESIFKCPVYERYGARDAGLMGYQVPREQSKDFIVDWANVLIEPEVSGTESGILVTKLHADGMPMIRYRIGDIGEFPVGSLPGHPSFRLKSVIGRNLDRIWMPDGRYIHGIQFPHMFKDFPLREFMVVQNEDYSLELQLAPCPNFSAQDEDAIVRLISKNLPGLQLRVTKTGSVSRTVANKWRPVVSKVVH